MKMPIKAASLAAILLAGLATPLPVAAKEADGEALYLKYCAECHHPERLGKAGPPLLPEYFGRKKKSELAEIVTKGLPATNMPAFAGAIPEDGIAKIVDYITTPVESPVWGAPEIKETLQASAVTGKATAPKYDMTNFFMIVEGGTGKVHFMEGDGFRLLGEVPVGAIHGGPKFGRELRTAFAVSRDGWIVRYDLVALKETGRVRGAISTRNIALSGDGRYLVQANLLPKNIVVFDTDTLMPVKIVHTEGTPGAVYDLQKRRKFVVSMKDSSTLFIFDDKLLDFEQLKLDQTFTDFFIDPDERWLVGQARDAKSLSVVDLDSGKVVRSVESAGGMPHLASAAIWQEGKTTLAAFPHIGKPLVAVLDMKEWQMRGSVETKGAGFFARTHANIPHIWVDTGTDTIQLIDKKTLKVVQEIVPEKGRQAMHIEFDKKGRHALVSIWEDQGAVVIYDTKSLKEVKRLPFKKPVGKYNATNKRF